MSGSQPDVLATSPQPPSIFFGNWSEKRESNPRPLGPEPSALPTALHPVSLSIIRFFPTAVKTEFSPAADDVCCGFEHSGCNGMSGGLAIPGAYVHERFTGMAAACLVKPGKI